MSSEQYEIHVDGCDDSTDVVLSLTPVELDVIVRLANAVEKAKQDKCQPRIRVWCNDELIAGAEL